MTISQSHLAVNSRQKLLPTDRRHLRQALGALPPRQFDEVTFLLGFSADAIPFGETFSQESAPQRSQTLLRWATSPVGPGIAKVEEVLANIISKHSTTTKVVLSFAITRNVCSITRKMVQAFVEHLKEKTEDTALDVDFFEPGGIKLILRGSEKGLERLQDLFELGKLSYSALPPIENIYLLDEHLLDERKARLVKALQLRDQFLSPYRARAHSYARTRANALSRTQDLTLARALVRDLRHTQSHGLDLTDDMARDRDLIRESTRDINTEIDVAHAIALVRALNQALSRTRTPQIARSIRLARSLARIHTYARYSTFTFGVDRAIAFALSVAIGRALRLALRRAVSLASSAEVLDLANADLRGANLVNLNLIDADLTGADLTGADLTGTDLTGAEVTGTIFGDNLGLTTEKQRSLQRNGAIFQNWAGLVWYREDTLYGL